MKLSRRNFVVGCSAAIAAMAGGRVTGLTFAAPNDPIQRDILVVVFLRGGCDGLSLVAPVDDPDYIAARTSELRVAARGDLAGLALQNTLDGLDFRLHPQAGGLKELYDSRQLAIVHACGLTDGTRSHFDAMDFMERGTPGNKNIPSGWLTRHLSSIGADGLLPSVAASASLPLSLLGNTTGIAVREATYFGLADEWGYGPQQQAALRKWYNGQTPLHQAGQRTLEAVEVISTRIPRDDQGYPLPYQPATEVEYPPDDYAYELNTSLKTVAQLIKMEVGLQVATVDLGGWDTHEGQGYLFPQQAEALSAGLTAFYNDLSRYHNRLTVVVMSEFGRRLLANDSGGTDHGHGNVMLALGGHVKGGRMYGQWPGLASEQLDDGADLAITTDYRTVLSEILVRRLANPKLGQVFPGLSDYQPLGLVKGDDLDIDLSLLNG